MRSINKMIMMLALLTVTTIVYGQQSEKTLLKTEVMADKLGLDAKQKAALDKQLKEAEAERKVMVEKMRALRQEMMRDAFVARQQREAELKEILTEEQWAAYLKMKEERKGRQVAMRKRGARKAMEGQGQRKPRFRKQPEKEKGNE